MVPGSDTNQQDQTRGRSSDEFGGPTTSNSGVDLKHPPQGIQDLRDVDKRFIAGTLREGYTQGLEMCQRRAGQGVDKRQNLKFADQWIADNVPFLSGVIGDVGEGSSSNR